MDSQLVRRFAANKEGRDWVVGDIHGAFELVITAMRVSGFDRRVDRLFVVGDLVDRGDDSMRALKFLSQPYIHCLRGNHEDMWLQLYRGGPPAKEVVVGAARVMGMGSVDWWLKAPHAERDTLVARFAELPLAIEVESERGLVGMVHADVPAEMSWPQFVAAIEAGDADATETALWGRRRAQTGSMAGVAGVGRIFAGHTPQRSIRRLGNVYIVDTGAIYGVKDLGRNGRLSMVNIVARTSTLDDSNAPSFGTPTVDVRPAGESDADAPFSSYFAA